MGLRGTGSRPTAARSTYGSISMPEQGDVLRIQEAVQSRTATRHATTWMAALGVACVMVIVGVSSVSDPATLRGTSLRESVAVAASGDCTCMASCDQKDAIHGTYCAVDAGEADCVGANGYPAACDDGVIEGCWATCSVIYGFDQCRDEPCQNNGFCVDGNSEYECLCQSGYTGKDCETEIDACDVEAWPANACAENAVCADLPPPGGSDHSGRTCTCNAGYAGDGVVCVDINACTESPCLKGFASCSDKPPPADGSADGRLCTCEPGYMSLAGGGGDDCIAIDACSVQPCDSNAACVDLPAPAGDDLEGRTCTCNVGYDGDGESCADINACDEYACPADAACMDRPAPALGGEDGRECICAEGYDFSNGESCEETDACVGFPCGEHAVCTDLYAPAGGNAAGRTCTCEDGYVESDIDASTCVQLDACSLGPCSEFADCDDLPPPADEEGYVCTCLAGYAGDGEYCAPIDACNVPARIEVRTGQVDGTATYAGSRELLDAVNAAAQEEGYGSANVDTATDLRNAEYFGASENVAWLITLRFTTNEETSLAFRLGVDFGRGGFAMLDSHIKAESYEDLKWSGEETGLDGSAGVFTIDRADLQPGNHELKVVGVDDCCDEGMTFEFKIIGGPWQAQANLQSIGEAPCHQDAECIDQNAPAGFEGYACRCNAGYTGDGATCSDVDGCTTSPCDENADCLDLPPPAPGDNSGRLCTCKTGYATGTDPLTQEERCLETDACAVTPCHEDAHCTDLGPPHEGDITGRICECKAGYSGDGEDCEPIDACQNNPCDARATCEDLPPPGADSGQGRTCTCNVGYVGDGESCTDVNACEFTPCDENADCDDLEAPAPETEEGRLCECSPGFVGDGETCTDVDACADNPCASYSTCQDLPAPADDSAEGRQCVCLPGYHTPEGRSSCVQIDACASFPCASDSAECDDLPPPAADGREGRTCTCATGYVGDGDVCTDVDACETAPCNNNAYCMDKAPPGLGDESGRECICNSGYQGDGELCEEIDACQVVPCDVNAICHDLPAPQNEDGFTCTCGAGYEGDGRTCTQVDACKTSPCSAVATCHDLPAPAGGDASGRVCHCNDGYAGNGDDCVNVQGCDTTQCDVNARCHDALPPSVTATCACNAGYEGDGFTCHDIDDCQVRYDTTIEVAGGAESCDLVCTKSMQTGMGATCVAAKGGASRVDCGYVPEDGSLKCFCTNKGSVGSTPLDDITKCMYGKCADTGLNAYSCDCEDGWTGRHCDHQMASDNCDDTTCSFGTCKDVGDDFVCTCQAGYSGKNCDVPPTHWVPLGKNTMASSAAEVAPGAGPTIAGAARGPGAGTYVAPAGWKLVKDTATYKMLPATAAPSKLCVGMGNGCLAHPASGPTVTGAYQGPAHQDLQVSGDPSAGPIYTIELFVADELDAGTTDPVYVVVHGADGGQTAPIAAFPSGADYASNNIARAYAADVGTVGQVEYFAHGTNAIKPAGLSVTVNGVMYSMDNGADDFAEATASQKGTYPVFDYSAQCANFRYSIDCGAVDLSATAKLSASSERDVQHKAAMAVVTGKYGDRGWAPKNKADGEWLQLDFGEDTWISRVVVYAGHTSTKICPEGLDTYEIQPPLCCEYLAEFKIVAKTSAMGHWFNVGDANYRGSCTDPTTVNIDPPIRAKLLQVVVQGAAKVEYPSVKLQVYGDGTFGHGTVHSTDGLSDDLVADSCGCYYASGPAAFAAGGKCDAAAPDSKYANVCPRPAAAKEGCTLTVKSCAQWGLGFMNGRDSWGEQHTDRDGFTAIGLTGQNEEACLRRAMEMYHFCKNEGHTDEVKIMATFNPTGATRTFPGSVTVTEATYGANCRYDKATKHSNGAMSCNKYCFNGGHHETPKESTCIAQKDLLDNSWLSCDAMRGESRKDVTCYCRAPNGEYGSGAHGVKDGNVNNQLKAACDGYSSCGFDALLLGDRDATSCSEALNVTYTCSPQGQAGTITRTVSANPVAAFPAVNNGECENAHDVHLPLPGWETFAAVDPQSCKEKCRMDPNCLAVSYYKNNMAQITCVPTMRNHITLYEGHICTIDNVPQCSSNGDTENCNAWGMTYKECYDACADNPYCYAFSYTSNDWNMAHPAGCVVWGEDKAAMCDTPAAQPSWNTFKVTRDNYMGCYGNVKSKLTNRLGRGKVSWAQCKQLALNSKLSFFALTDSLDAEKGTCFGGDSVTPDYIAKDAECVFLCKEKNGCTLSDSRSTDRGGHRLGGVAKAPIYSVEVVAVAGAKDDTWQCFSKNTQVVTLDCSENLGLDEFSVDPAAAAAATAAR